MTRIIFFAIFKISTTAFSQDTLREVEAIIYEKYYVLKSDSTFYFYTELSTGNQCGRGTYQLTSRKIVFQFKPITEPIDSSTCASDITIFNGPAVVEMKNKGRGEFVNKLVYWELKNSETGKMGKVIFRKKYSLNN